MNKSLLSTHMAGMADEVNPVDLRDRVLASSRRVTVRRRILVSSAAAVAAVAVASGIAWAGLPAPNGSIKVAVSPTPSVSTSPSPAAAIIPDRLYYLAKNGSLQLAEGSRVSTLVKPPSPACGLTVSPDRTRIAWVTTDGGGATGDLKVAALDGSNARTVKTGVSCMGGNSPLWTPDSRELLLTRGNTNPRVLVAADDGHVRPTPLRDVTDYIALSPNGAYVAYRDSGEVVVARWEGEEVHRFAHGDETPTGGFSVQGVSDDGKRVVLGMSNTDPDLIRTGSTVVDAETGDDLRSDPDSALYFNRGTATLARIGGSLTLLSPEGNVLDTRTEPAALRDATLLAAF